MADLPQPTMRYYEQILLIDHHYGETSAAHYSCVHLEQLMLTHQEVDGGVPFTC